MTRPTYYILNDKKVEPFYMQDELDLVRWSRIVYGDTEYRRVALDVLDVNGTEVKISTVFLGMDHSYSPSGPPMLFETMVFGGEHNDYQDRCSTYDEAEAMHNVAIKLVLGIKKEKE